MSPQFSDSYTSDHRIEADGIVEFKCSTDIEKWPWLALPPRHPAVVQTQNFWASIGAIIALDERAGDNWTALTWTDWECADCDAGIAAAGRYEQKQDDERASYSVTLFDDQSREIVRTRGHGVVFKNRNFEEWREQSKSESKSAQDDAPPVYAPRELLNLTSAELPLVLASDERQPTIIEGLVTPENGFPPANRMLSGSGDHVNATHIAEAARQSLSLILDGTNFEVTGGEITFKRYVELGARFRLEVGEREANQITFALTQSGRPCSDITLRWRMA